MKQLLCAMLLLLAACQPLRQPDVPPSPENQGAAAVHYGSWPSPITAAVIQEDSRWLAGLATDEGYLYWVEGRPEEGGRVTIMRWKPGAAA
ncbi:MAG: hypothetical protein ACK2U9_26285, partial [Anaerolineae bacterium]